jgi:hypothetical protein
VVVLLCNLVTGLLIVLLCSMSLTIATYLYYTLYFFHESFWIWCEISFFSASLPRVKYLKTLHFV